MLSAWFFGWWASLSDQPPVIITTIAMTVLAATLVIYTHVPVLLQRRFPRPFAVKVDEMMYTEQDIVIPVFILNRSSQDNLVLVFDLFLTCEGSPERWVSSPGTKDIEHNLGPKRSTTGVISIHSDFLKPYTQAPGFEAWLRIIDRVSGRWAKFRVPGDYPKTFFHLK